MEGQSSVPPRVLSAPCLDCIGAAIEHLLYVELVLARIMTTDASETARLQSCSLVMFRRQVRALLTVRHAKGAGIEVGPTAFGIIKPSPSVNNMPTTIKAADLIESIAAALQYISKSVSGHLARLLVLLVATAGSGSAMAQQDLWRVVRERPNIVVVMRHTETSRGSGAAFDASGKCAGELMLTTKGRSDAEAIGKMFASQGLAPERLNVVSSAMCRNRDTAILAFGKADLDPALRESFSGAAGRMTESIDAAEAHIRRLRGAKPLILLTHLPNIDALTGEQPDHHHAVVAESDDKGQLTTLGLLKLL
jgi:phosphohistidine phosphatase SixA